MQACVLVMRKGARRSAECRSLNIFGGGGGGAVYDLGREVDEVVGLGLFRTEIRRSVLVDKAARFESDPFVDQLRSLTILSTIYTFYSPIGNVPTRQT